MTLAPPQPNLHRMKATLEKVAMDALQLPDQERAALAHTLIQSLDPQADEDPAEVEKSWLLEIERRMKDVRAGQTGGRPAEEIFAELRAKYG